MLRVQIVDKGMPRDMPRIMPFGWGGFHLDVISQVLKADDPEREPGWPTEHTVKGNYVAIDEADGEEFRLNAGDKIYFF